MEESTTKNLRRKKVFHIHFIYLNDMRSLVLRTALGMSLRPFAFNLFSDRLRWLRLFYFIFSGPDVVRFGPNGAVWEWFGKCLGWQTHPVGARTKF